MSGMFASPLMVGGEILLGLSLAMFVAAMIGVYGDRMLTNRRLSDLDLEGMLIMKLATVAAALTLASALWIAPAEAKGCLKGAVVGGVAGHYAGHHGVMGAIGGCAVGHHMANEKAKQQAAPEGAQSAQPSN